LPETTDCGYSYSVQTIFLVGPTAVGKSAVAIELARRLNAEIVSADSMQVYRGMDIGTAKATRGERREIPHHLIDVCEVGEVFDVKRFVEMSQSLITSLQSPLIICGGTGLYIRALRHGLFEGPGRDEKLRGRLEKMPVGELFAELERLDPVTAATIDRHNPRRLVRALEVFHTTGNSISNLQSQWNQSPTTNHQSPIFCLTRDRAELVARIEQRIDEQMAAGWLDEVKRLMAAGLERNPTAMQAAGYKELVAHLRGELTLPAAVALIKTRTRQLAKRQMTWFRKEPDLIWLAIGRDEPPAETATRIMELRKIR
jgi:tRNA dimethylallyltransferase